MLTNIKPLSTMLLHPSEEWKQVIDVRTQRWMAHPNFIILRVRNFTPCMSMYVYMICVRIDAVCVILSLIDFLQLKVANIFYCTCLNLNEPPLVEKTAHRCFSEDGDHPLDQPPRRKDKKGLNVVGDVSVCRRVHYPSNGNLVSCVFLGFSLCITPAGLFLPLKESLPTSLGLSPLSKLETWGRRSC